MHAGLKLPFRFDAQRLKSDLALVNASEWRPHYNRNDYEGDWRGAALRSSDGSAANLAATYAAASGFRDTPLMARCEYLREAVSVFECPVRAVRLLALAPGAFIREHTDHALVYEDGEMRVHIPVQTAPEVEFYVAGERLFFEEGHCYYVNVHLPHRITNRSRAERIHLVIDLEVNEWVHKLVRAAREEHAAIPRTAPPENSFAAFAAHVFENPVLRDRLRSIPERSEWIAAALCAAEDRGFDVLEADLEAALLENRAVRAPRDSASRLALAETQGWTPFAADFRDGKPLLEWIYTGSRRFCEPFFHQTIQECLARPFCAAFRSESRLDELEEASFANALAPAGFIFHSSRCGSTLLAQMHAALPRTIVMSEPLPLDRILQAHLALPDLAFDEQVRWIRRLILALGQRRSGLETHSFLKLDSWHIHRLPLLRAAFPETPALFLFRNPFEILRSHALSPGRQALPGLIEDPRALGLTIADIPRLTPDEWCAQVLSRIFQSALAFRPPEMLFVDYPALPEAALTSIARHFSVALSVEEQETMRRRACLPAKNDSPWPNSYDTLAPERIERLRELSATLDPLYVELRRLASPE